MSDVLDLVSVCIPTFNGAQFLEETLESVRAQTYPLLEVIISDDQSTDNSLELAAAFKSEVNFEVKIFNHQRSSIGANWNNCLRKATGKYIKFLFQDDIIRENCIEKMVDLAKKDERIGLVYCRRDFLVQHENRITKLWISKYSNLHIHWKNFQVNEDEIRDGKEFLKDPNLLNQPINKIGEPSAVLIKKECFELTGLFHNQLHQELDAELWYRIMKFYKIGFLTEKLVFFRLHSKQATQENSKKEIPDKKLMPYLIFKNLFWHLHPVVKWNLLKKLLIKK